MPLESYINLNPVYSRNFTDKPPFISYLYSSTSTYLTLYFFALVIYCRHSRSFARASPRPQAVESPVGPFTIHGWAPMFKWLLSISNILDFNRPIESVSMAQQTALTATGFIWARYSLVITPKNYSLFLVNFCLGLTGAYQLARKAIAGTPAPVKAI